MDAIKARQLSEVSVARRREIAMARLEEDVFPEIKKMCNNGYYYIDLPSRDAYQLDVLKELGYKVTCTKTFGESRISWDDPAVYIEREE